MNTFTLGNTTFQVTSKVAVDSSLANLRDSLITNGKEAVIYYAGKVLKSGKVSAKQRGMFYRFVESGKMVRAL